MSLTGIAAIGGDGIGMEVMRQCIRVVQAATSQFDIAPKFHCSDFSSPDCFGRDRKMRSDCWWHWPLTCAC